MSPKTLSSARAPITRDWARAFPVLGTYRPLWLARRIGPLVQGICLDRNSGNDAYCPTPHLHCLARPFPVLAFVPGRRVLDDRSGAEMWVRVGRHVSEFERAVEATVRQSVLPFEDAPGVDAIVAAYRAFIDSGPVRWDLHHGLREDLASVLAWFGRLGEGAAVLSAAALEMRAWEPRYLPEGGPDAWLERESMRIQDAEALRSTVQEQSVALKVDRLPAVHPV